METKMAFISVILPLYNEEKYIESCVKSLLRQDYPKEKMEWIFVDGNSTDRTVEILKSYQCRYSNLIKILNNPDKTVPYAMNIGIKNSTGKYIIRLDGHAEYNDDYISKCVHYLDTTDADNVGGIAITKSSNFTGNAIAMILSSKFGVGNSQFRTGGKSGYVDTVPFGAFRREVFERLGGYDVGLTRNEDNEMNYRIRANGGKIYLSDEIVFSYYCRDSVQGIVNMAVQNGYWNVVTMSSCPGSMGVRHFMPLLFLLSLIFLPLLGLIHEYFFFFLGIELLLYVLLGLFFAIKSSAKIYYIPFVFILFPVFHIAYGLGSLFGLIRVLCNSLGRWN